MTAYGSCLLVGPWGSGKTTAASTAPKPVLFLDMDNKLHRMGNMASKIASKEVIQWPIAEALSMFGLRRLVTTKHEQGGDVSVQRPDGYLKLVEYIEKLQESKCVVDGKKIETVVLDSYTTTIEHIKRMLLAINKKSTMTMPLYGALLSNLEELNNTLLRLPCNVVIICHEKYDRDEITGKIMCTPLIEGQMAQKIGKDFEEVYYSEKVIDKGEAKYFLNTLGDHMRACRTSRNLPAQVEPDLTKIFGGYYEKK